MGAQGEVIRQSFQRVDAGKDMLMLVSVAVLQGQILDANCMVRAELAERLEIGIDKVCDLRFVLWSIFLQCEGKTVKVEWLLLK